MQIEIFSDVACPWCYIGKRRFEAALAQFEHDDQVQVRWRSYQLDPSLPAHYDGSEVDYLVQRTGMDRQSVSGMTQQVAAQAAEVGLDYDFEKLVVANSLPAHHLIHLARAHGRDGEAKEALLAAHFVDGLDIGDEQTLVTLGESIGLDAEEVRVALSDAQVEEEIRADFAKAREYGVTGVPFFVFDGKFAVSGAQPAEVFTQALDQAWAQAGPVPVMAAQSASGAAAADQHAACGPDGCVITPAED
ncbi:DsbA family oxidoreductase [Dermacoccaceae bacterium W4C1]